MKPGEIYQINFIHSEIIMITGYEKFNFISYITTSNEVSTFHKDSLMANDIAEQKPIGFSENLTFEDYPELTI